MGINHSYVFLSDAVFKSVYIILMVYCLEKCLEQMVLRMAEQFAVDLTKPILKITALIVGRQLHDVDK